MRSTLPTVTFAEHVGGYRVRIVFSDETENVVDCRAWLVGPVFEPLRDEAYFRA